MNVSFSAHLGVKASYNYVVKVSVVGPLVFSHIWLHTN